MKPYFQFYNTIATLKYIFCLMCPSVSPVSSFKGGTLITISSASLIFLLELRVSVAKISLSKILCPESLQHSPTAFREDSLVRRPCSFSLVPDRHPQSTCHKKRDTLLTLWCLPARHLTKSPAETGGSTLRPTAPHWTPPDRSMASSFYSTAVSGNNRYAVTHTGFLTAETTLVTF